MDTIDMSPTWIDVAKMLRSIVSGNKAAEPLADEMIRLAEEYEKEKILKNYYKWLHTGRPKEGVPKPKGINDD